MSNLYCKVVATALEVELVVGQAGWWSWHSLVRPTEDGDWYMEETRNKFSRGLDTSADRDLHVKVTAIAAEVAHEIARNITAAMRFGEGGWMVGLADIWRTRLVLALAGKGIVVEMEPARVEYIWDGVKQ